MLYKLSRHTCLYCDTKRDCENKVQSAVIKSSTRDDVSSSVGIIVCEGGDRFGVATIFSDWI